MYVLQLLDDIEIAQKHLLRPIVAIGKKKEELEEMMKMGIVDKILDEETTMMLIALKHDSD